MGMKLLGITCLLAVTGISLGQNGQQCGDLSRSLARCLMTAQASAQKDAQQEAAEAAVLECSQWKKNNTQEFLVGAPCRQAIQQIHDRIQCMDTGFANDSFQESMLSCIGNSTMDAVARTRPGKRRQQQHFFQQGAQMGARGQQPAGPMGPMGGPGGPQQPSEMDVCLQDRSFQTCMRSDVAKAHFERGFKNSRRQQPQGQQQAREEPCTEEQRKLAEAGCPAEPLPDTLCPCKCGLVEALKTSCGFPAAPLTCPQICDQMAAQAAAMQNRMG